jgi:hypothetical protein
MSCAGLTWFSSAVPGRLGGHASLLNSNLSGNLHSQRTPLFEGGWSHVGAVTILHGVSHPN